MYSRQNKKRKIYDKITKTPKKLLDLRTSAIQRGHAQRTLNPLI